MPVAILQKRKLSASTIHGCAAGGFVKLPHGEANISLFSRQNGEQ